MQVFVTQKIGNKLFIKNVEKLHIDPIATQQNWNQYFATTPLFAEIQKLQDRANKLQLDIFEALQKKQTKKCQALNKAMMILQQDLQLIGDRVTKERNGFFRDSAIYFEPRKNDVVIDAKNKHVLEKFLEKGNNEYVDIDGNKYTQYDIDVLIYKNASKQEQEKIIDTETRYALESAKAMREEFEIQRNGNALELSQAHYEDLIEKIGAKYGN